MPSQVRWWWSITGSQQSSTSVEGEHGLSLNFCSECLKLNKISAPDLNGCFALSSVFLSLGFKNEIPERVFLLLEQVA